MVLADNMRHDGFRLEALGTRLSLETHLQPLIIAVHLLRHRHLIHRRVSVHVRAALQRGAPLCSVPDRLFFGQEDILSLVKDVLHLLLRQLSSRLFRFSFRLAASFHILTAHSGACAV